jgi:ABC-type polysaccharide/polyol phosphate export permease
VLLVATAASAAVAALLQRTFGAISRTSGRPLIVQDVVPLPASDSTGATTFSAILGLIIAGLAGTSLVYTFTRHRGEGVRILATFVLAVCAGFLTAVITNFVVGAYPGHFFGVWGVATLFLLAIGMPIAAMQVLFGVAGGAIGWVLFFVIGNPASGGSSAPELLPGFWRALSQGLPPGAAVTSLRDVVYFHSRGSLHSMIVLALYALVGFAVAIGVYRLRVRRTPAATNN